MKQNTEVKRSLTIVNTEAVIPVQGLNTLVIDITGTFTATVAFEYTINGSDWYSLSAINNSSGSVATGATAVGVFKVDVSAYQLVRVRCSAFTSGSIEVFMRGVTFGTAKLGDGSSESHIGQVTGSLNTVSTEMTRPADTTAYTSGDVVSNATSGNALIVMTDLARITGGTGYIVGARLSTDKKSITPRFRVHLFNASNLTFSVDNVAYKEVYADSSKRLGYFDLGAMTTATDTTNSDMSRSMDMALRIPYKAATGTKSIYALLEALDGFTPASGEKFTLTLYADNN